MADLTPNSKPDRHAQRRALLELAIGYLLILFVIWTPRPWQRVLWLVAVAGIAAITCLSIKGSVTREAFRAMGLRKENFLRSLWVVGVALVLAAVAFVAGVDKATLQFPVSPATGEGGLLVSSRPSGATRSGPSCNSSCCRAFFCCGCCASCPARDQPPSQQRACLPSRICPIRSWRR